MTSDIALIALGSITQVVTFTIGVLVGRLMSRRIRHDDSNSNEEELPTRWRHAPDGDTATGSLGRGGRRADTKPETDAYERALREWHYQGD